MGGGPAALDPGSLWTMSLVHVPGGMGPRLVPRLGPHYIFLRLS